MNFKKKKMSFEEAVTILSSLRHVKCAFCWKSFNIVGRHTDGTCCCKDCFVNKGYGRRSMVLFGDLNQTMLYELIMVEHALDCHSKCTDNCQQFKQILKHNCNKKNCILCSKKKGLMTIHEVLSCETDSILA
jgi:hypothetical protein